MSDQAWMDAAWSHVGVHETAGPKATAEIIGFFARAGHPEVTSDETAWCAAFAGACLADAGLPNSGSLLARSYLKYGTELTEPRVGAIAVFKRGSDPSQGHVAFVTGWGPGVIRVLGGNQRDSVCEENMKAENLLGLRWPPVVEQAPPAPNPLHKSGTIRGIVSAAIEAIAGPIAVTLGLLTEAATKFNELQPVHGMLSQVGANAKALSLGFVAASLTYAASRRVKAGQEGKAG